LIFKVAVLGAVLHHEDLAIALNDLGLDLADLFIEEDFVGQLAVEDLLADLRDALGAERVSGAGPSEGRLLFLPALLQGLVSPLRREGCVGADAVEPLVDNPRAFSRVNGCLFHVFDRFGHVLRSPQGGLRIGWPAHAPGGCLVRITLRYLKDHP
jgi:hypothetical protein